MQTLASPRASRVRKRLLALGAALALVALLMAALGIVSRPGPVTPTPARPATGAPVDGIPCGGESFAIHHHVQVDIRVNGQEMTVPAGVGVVVPTRVVLGQIVTAQCFYWLHTHDSTGLIHVEAPYPLPFTLGQFFDIWGEPLAPNGVLGQTGILVAEVNGQPYQHDPRSIGLTDGEQIRLDLQTTANPLVWLRVRLP